MNTDSSYRSQIVKGDSSAASLEYSSRLEDRLQDFLTRIFSGYSEGTNAFPLLSSFKIAVGSPYLPVHVITRVFLFVSVLIPNRLRRHDQPTRILGLTGPQ